MTMYWLAIDKGEQHVIGAYTSKRDAMRNLVGSFPFKSRRKGPGAYEVHWWHPEDPAQGDSFFLGCVEGEHYGSWQAVAKDWVAAGRPIGRLTSMSSGFPEEAVQRPPEP